MIAPLEYWFIKENMWITAIGALLVLITFIKENRKNKKRFDLTLSILAVVFVFLGWWHSAFQTYHNAPRHLSEYQETKIISMLSPYAHLKATVIIFWRKDKEARHYGEQWVEVLKASEWNLPQANREETDAVGVEIQTKDLNTLNETNAAAKILENAFNSVGIKPHREANQKQQLKEDQILLLIGERE